MPIAFIPSSVENSSRETTRREQADAPNKHDYIFAESREHGIAFNTEMSEEVWKNSFNRNSTVTFIVVGSPCRWRTAGGVDNVLRMLRFHHQNKAYVYSDAEDFEPRV